MSNNDNNKGISSAASRYLQIIDKGEKKNEEELMDTTAIYNQLVRRETLGRETSSLMKPFRDVINSTDILFDDSDGNYMPATDQFSFFNSGNKIQHSMSSDTALSNNIFDINSSSSFLGPPYKRFCANRDNSFFNTLDSDRSVMMDTFSKIAPNTDDIFDSNNFKSSSFQSMNLSLFKDAWKPVERVEFRLSSSDSMLGISSELSSFQKSGEEMTFADAMEKVDESNDMNIQENLQEKKSKTVNTFYQVPYSSLLDTAKIDEYYKTHDFSDWESMMKDVNTIMEPSVDYIAYRLKRLRNITVGNKEEVIPCDEPDPFSCDSINETMEEITSSFETKEFVCSTPEETVDSRTNPLDIGFMNLVSDALSGSMTQKQDQNDDANTTKSFIVNKEASQNAWLALTHVSCSIPNSHDQLTDNEPMFDITTIFDFTNHEDLLNNKTAINQDQYVDNDMTRYELLHSILNDFNDPFEKTAPNLHETIKIVQNRKAAIMAHIEMIIQGLVTSLTKQQSMIIKFHKVKNWDDCKFESNVLSQKETAVTVKSISFMNKRSKKTFTVMVRLLGEIHKILASNTTCTKRELYYRDVELSKCQNSVNRALDDICALLNVQAWELGILSTSKGLVAGDLKITTEDGEVIDYTTTNSVPQKPSGIKSMESNAEYILVVEKDTVFTRLIEEKIMEKIGSRIILVTAKGYPDVNTRLLLKKFESELQIPIYIIVDGDPFGIDIMCTYKFGSLQMVNFSEQLAISKMEWIGIHPTDIEKLDITRTELTDADKKKVDELMARPYINPHLHSELKHLKEHGWKAEIESIYHYSIDYFIYDYLPQKIASVSTPMDKLIQEANCFKENLF